LRAGFELLARIGEPPEGPVYDLGCGTGEHATALAERWPEREVVGVDRSPQMLARARVRRSRVRWLEADLERWSPPAEAALIVSIAALQWLPEPARAMRALFEGLRPGGVLAVEMPLNFDAPSHVLLRETAAEARWAERLAGRVRRPDVPDAATAYDLLAPVAAGRPDTWETEYLHPLEGEDAVLRWVEGTALTPVREALDRESYAAFAERYGARLREAYPRRSDGVTLFAFRRVFAIAARRPA
jgi:trans-aconitate 2-methyltransferase